MIVTFKFLLSIVAAIMALGRAQILQHPTLESIVQSMPKMELHAHLHGSIRPSTLAELALYRGIDLSAYLEGSRDLHKCFALFGAIHGLIDHQDILKRVLVEVLQDFSADNVIYLELRTTPRRLPADGTTKAGYLRLISSIIKEHNRVSGGKMLVRLLVSIDRSKSVAENEELLTLLQDDVNDDIVGIDFSGNPLVNRFSDYHPLMDRFRASGRSITVHAAEVEDSGNSSTTTAESDQCLRSSECSSSSLHEFDSILSFGPHRLGHALYLQSRHVEVLLEMNRKFRAQGSGPGPSSAQQRPPLIEVCPTSNRFTLNHSTYGEHPHLQTWLTNEYPIAISTDDAGVFATNLSNEFLNVVRAFRLSITATINLAAMPISFIFEPNRKLVAERFASRLWAIQSRQMLVLPNAVSELL